MLPSDNWLIPTKAWSPSNSSHCAEQKHETCAGENRANLIARIDLWGKPSKQSSIAGGGQHLMCIPRDLPYFNSVGGWLRHWTEEERNAIFQNYFDASPAGCPVCTQWLSFPMQYTSEIVTLSARCENCENCAVLFFGILIGLPA